MRPIMAMNAVMVMALVGASGAVASTAGVFSGTLTINGGDNSNEIRVERPGGGPVGFPVRVRDYNLWPMDPNSGCKRGGAGPAAVWCQEPSLISASLGNGDDVFGEHICISASVSGGNGDDRIGTCATTEVFGDDGNDVIDAGCVFHVNWTQSFWANDLNGGPGNDHISGCILSTIGDLIVGGPGSDTLLADDTLVDGGGNDLVSSNDGFVDLVRCSGGTDVVYGHDAFDTFESFHGCETIL